MIANGPPGQHPASIRTPLSQFPTSGSAQPPVGYPAAIHKPFAQYPTSGLAQPPAGIPGAIHQPTIQYPTLGAAHPPVGYPAAIHQSSVPTPQAPPQCRTVPLQTSWQHSATEKQYNVGGAVPSSVVVYDSNEVPGHIKQLVENALGHSSQTTVPQQYAKKSKGKQSNGKKVKAQQAPMPIAVPGQRPFLPTQVAMPSALHPTFHKPPVYQNQVLHAPPMQYPVNTVLQQLVVTPQPRQIVPGMILSPPARPALGTPSQAVLQVPNQTLLGPNQAVLIPSSTMAMPNTQLSLHQPQVLQHNPPNPAPSNNRSVLGTINRAMDIAEPFAEAADGISPVLEEFTGLL